MSSIATHVILTYNDLSYLFKILDMSISNSKFIQKDILIIDDGSDIPVESDLKSRYDFPQEKIFLIRHQGNKGIQEAIKTAIRNVKTKYIYLGSSNDKISPRFFYEHVQVLERYAFAPFSFSDPGMFDEGKKSYSNFKLSLSSSEIFLKPSEFLNIYRRSPFHIGSNTVLYRTDDLKSVGIKEDLKLYADWFLNYFLAFKKGCVYIPEVLSHFCIHKNSYSSLQLQRDNSDKIIKFFKYVHADDPEVYAKMKEAGFISAFPLQDIIKVSKHPIIKPCITKKVLFMCFWRNIWHIVHKILPVSTYNTLRKIKNKCFSL